MFKLFSDVYASSDVGPTESECRPYIEKAINELKTGDEKGNFCFLLYAKLNLHSLAITYIIDKFIDKIF